MKPSLRLLMTACGAPGAPGILKCLRNNGERDIFIYGVDVNRNAVGFPMVDGGQTCPPGQDAHYVEQILEIACEHNLQIVLPLSTMELESLARAKAEFTSRGIVPLVSDLQGLRVANNKGSLMEAAGQCGVPVPRSIRVRTVDEFEEAVRRLGYPDRPVCFKPELGRGGRGFRMLNASQSRFEQLFDEKPGGTLMALDEALGVLSEGKQIPPVLVMEWLPGEEYSVDVLCLDGRCLVAIPRVRNVIKLGICFIGETRRHDQCIAFAQRIVRELRLSYCINLQFKLDDSAVPILLEVNPRVSGTIVLCAAAGVNLPYLAVKLAMGEPIGAIAPSWGTRMVRYWDEVFYDPRGQAFAIPDRLERLRRPVRPEPLDPTDAPTP